MSVQSNPLSWPLPVQQEKHQNPTRAEQEEKHISNEATMVKLSADFSPQNQKAKAKLLLTIKQYCSLLLLQTK